MICNSNKDGYSDPNDAPRREGPGGFPLEFRSQHGREDIPDNDDIVAQYDQLDYDEQCRVKKTIYDLYCKKSSNYNKAIS